MHTKFAVAAFAVVAVSAFAAGPAMAQIVIQGGNPGQSQADRQAAHQDRRASRDAEDQARVAADHGDYHAAARDQDVANQDRAAAHDAHRDADQSRGPTIVIGH